MLRGLVIMLSLSASLQAFAQGSSVTQEQLESSFQTCLETAAQGIVNTIEEAHGKAYDSGYKKGPCNEEKMTCTVQVMLQYRDTDNRPLKAILGSQDVIFMEQEQGLCSDTIALGEPFLSILKAQ